MLEFLDLCTEFCMDPTWIYSASLQARSDTHAVKGHAVNGHTSYWSSKYSELVWEVACFDAAGHACGIRRTLFLCFSLISPRSSLSHLIGLTSNSNCTKMALSMIFAFLGLLQLTLSAPSGYSTTPGRLIGNSFGVPGQNLTYDYIVCASIPLQSISQLD